MQGEKYRLMGRFVLAAAFLSAGVRAQDEIPPLQDPHPMPDVRNFVQSVEWKDGGAVASFSTARWNAAPEPDAPMAGAVIHYRVNGGGTRSLALAGAEGRYRGTLPGVAASDSVAYYFVQELKGKAGPIRVNTSWFGRRMGRAAPDLPAPRTYTFASRFRDRHESEWLYDHYVQGYTDSTFFFVTIKDYGDRLDMTMETLKPSLFSTLSFYDFGGLTPGYDLTRLAAGSACQRMETKGVTGLPDLPQDARGGFTRFKWLLEPVSFGQQFDFEFVWRIRNSRGEYQAYYTESIRYYAGHGFQPVNQHPFANANGPLSINAVSDPRFAFNQHLNGPLPGTLVRFLAGKSLFDTDWEHGRIMNPQTPNGCEIPHEKGELRLDYAVPPVPIAKAYLGPRFNNTSCTHCHFMDGRGTPGNQQHVPFKTMLMRLSLPGVDAQGGPRPHPVYGGQLREFAAPGSVPAGRFEVNYQEIESGVPGVKLQKPIYVFKGLLGDSIDGDKVLYSPRVAPQVPGLGLLAGVSDADLLDLAARQAQAGRVSGKPNRVWDLQAGALRIGRFGWKAGQPSLRQQVAAAAAFDIGLSNPLFRDSAGAAELDAAALDRLVDYLDNLALPPRRNWQDPEAIAGKALFEQAQCGDCHAPVLMTSLAGYDIPPGAFPIQPFTDLLLHDMGPGLADGRPEFDADPQEWRTPPLWGVGMVEDVNLHTRYLHDGRARNLLEAILWHDGEAGKSRQAVVAMSESERKQLLAYVWYPFADVPATVPLGTHAAPRSGSPGRERLRRNTGPQGMTVAARGLGVLYRGDASEVGSIRILSPSGRLIRELRPGPGLVTWDLRDGSGAAVGNGLCLVQITGLDGRTLAARKAALHR